MNDSRLSEAMRAIGTRSWSGPDHSRKVEAMLSKERTMTTQKKSNKHTLAFLLIATAGTSALAGAFAHHTLVGRGVMETDDGARYNVEILESPAGANGTFVTDEGVRYHIRTSGAMESGPTFEADRSTVTPAEQPEAQPESDEN